MTNYVIKVQFMRGPTPGMSDEHNANQPIITEIYCAESFRRLDAFKKHPIVEFVSVRGDHRTNHRYVVNGEPFTGIIEEGTDASLRPAARVWVETLTGNRIESAVPNNPTVDEPKIKLDK